MSAQKELTKLMWCVAAMLYEATSAQSSSGVRNLTNDVTYTGGLCIPVGRKCLLLT